MDILIKNMSNNPKDSILEEHLLDGTVIMHEVVEVPPHGRCIDADELGKAVEKMVICDSYEYTIAHEMIKGLLKVAPTVLEATE